MTDSTGDTLSPPHSGALSARRRFAVVALLVVGCALLLFGLFGSITAPGTNTVNLDRMHGNLLMHIWGFGLVCCGLLLARPYRP